MVGGSINPIPNAGCEDGNLNFPATTNNDEVVFRAVSPHGHVYWEIDPSRNVSERIKPLESIPNPSGSLLEQCCKYLNPFLKNLISRFFANLHGELEFHEFFLLSICVKSDFTNFFFFQTKMEPLKLKSLYTMEVGNLPPDTVTTTL